MNKITKIKFWLPAIFWMLIIFSFSAHPAIQTSQIDWQDFFLKKTAHFMEYAILTGLYIYALKRTTHHTWSCIILFAICLSSLYALSDEFHQTFVPGREPRIRDVIIDITGSLSIGLFLLKKTGVDNTHYRV